MAHLVCYDHRQRSQVVETPRGVAVILHRSDKERCSGSGVKFGAKVLFAEEIIVPKTQ